MDRLRERRSERRCFWRYRFAGICESRRFWCIVAAAVVIRSQRVARQRAEPEVREFTLTAEQIEWELQPGTHRYGVGI